MFCFSAIYMVQNKIYLHSHFKLVVTYPYINTWNIQICKNVHNVHKHRNPKNTKHWRLSWYRYETLITFFKFRFSTQGERDTQFFYADCSSFVSFQLTDSTNALAHPAVHKLTGLNQVRKINSLRLSPNLNSLLLFKITKNPSPSLPGMMSFTSPVPFLIWGFLLWHLWLSHPPRMRVNTCTQCVHLTNPCTKPKGSKPN